MNVDDYIKNVVPARHASVLSPFRKDLLRLQEDGYTLSQLQSFLAANHVVVSTSWIAAYLAKPPGKTRQRKRDDGTPGQATKSIGPALTEPAVEPCTETGTDEQKPHSPKTLDRIINSRPDMDALSKRGRVSK